MATWGQVPDPFACWLLERGIKTLEVRVKRQNETAMGVAEWCSTRTEIARVHYSGLPTHPDHEIAKTTMNGFGGMLGIELRGGGPAALAFLRKLQLFTPAASRGGVDSLVIEPRYSSHEHMTPEERAKIGIPDGFVRVSIGLESAEDLILDLEQALAPWRLIRLHDVTKEYPRSGVALSGVTFEVKKGEFVFLTGPSGSGKSTILKFLYMDDKPTTGKVGVDGVRSDTARGREISQLRRRIGIVFQDFRLLEDRTAEANF